MRSTAQPIVEQTPLTALYKDWSELNHADAIKICNLISTAAPRHKRDANGLFTGASVNVAELTTEHIGMLDTHVMFTTPKMEVKVKRSGKGLVVVLEWDNTPKDYSTEAALATIPY